MFSFLKNLNNKDQNISTKRKLLNIAFGVGVGGIALGLSVSGWGLPLVGTILPGGISGATGLGYGASMTIKGILMTAGATMVTRAGKLGSELLFNKKGEKVTQNQTVSEAPVQQAKFENLEERKMKTILEVLDQGQNLSVNIGGNYFDLVPDNGKYLIYTGRTGAGGYKEQPGNPKTINSQQELQNYLQDPNQKDLFEALANKATQNLENQNQTTNQAQTVNQNQTQPQPQNKSSKYYRPAPQAASRVNPNQAYSPYTDSRYVSEPQPPQNFEQGLQSVQQINQQLASLGMKERGVSIFRNPKGEELKVPNSYELSREDFNEKVQPILKSALGEESFNSKSIRTVDGNRIDLTLNRTFNKEAYNGFFPSSTDKKTPNSAPETTEPRQPGTDALNTLRQETTQPPSNETQPQAPETTIQNETAERFEDLSEAQQKVNNLVEFAAKGRLPETGTNPEDIDSEQKAVIEDLLGYFEISTKDETGKDIEKEKLLNDLTNLFQRGKNSNLNLNQEYLNLRPKNLLAVGEAQTTESLSNQLTLSTIADGFVIENLAKAKQKIKDIGEILGGEENSEIIALGIDSLGKRGSLFERNLKDTITNKPEIKNLFKKAIDFITQNEGKLNLPPSIQKLASEYIKKKNVSINTEEIGLMVDLMQEKNRIPEEHTQEYEEFKNSFNQTFQEISDYLNPEA